MTLRVDPQALRAYAARLSEALAHAEAGRQYVNANGSFTAQETGLIGYLIPHHHAYVDALNRMLNHIAKVTDASEQAMNGIARAYERTDKRSAQELDAGYPAVARPAVSHEAQERNYPAPPTNVW